MSKKVKKIIKHTFLALFVNQSSIAVSPLALVATYDSKIEIADEQKILYNNLPQNFEIIDYLNISNSLANYNWNENIKNEVDCKDYALATYDTYQHLVKINGREDLEDKVRLVVGWQKIIGHVNLEYIDEGKYKSYETTLFTPQLNVNEVQFYSKYTRDIKTSFPLEKVWGRTVAGTKLPYPTVDGFLFPGGFVRLMYKSLEYRL